MGPPTMREMLIAKYHYDQDTGLFTYKSTHLAGRVAASYHERGYKTIRLNRKPYLAHRMAWLYVYGVLPVVIDHINGITDDNRIVNLRNVGHSHNQINTKLSSRNKSGFRGVCWNKKDKAWKVTAGFNGVAHHLGCFKDKLMAAKAYSDFAMAHHGEYMHPDTIAQHNAVSSLIGEKNA